MTSCGFDILILAFSICSLIFNFVQFCFAPPILLYKKSYHKTFSVNFLHTQHVTEFQPLNAFFTISLKAFMLYQSRY